MLRLHGYTGEERYFAEARRTLSLLRSFVEQQPFAFSHMLEAIDLYQRGAVEIVLVGERGTSGAEEWIERLGLLYLPNRALFLADPRAAAERLRARGGAGQIAGRRQVDGLRLPRADLHGADYLVRRVEGRAPRLSADAARRAATAKASGPAYAPMALNRTAVAERSALKVAVLNAAGGADFDAILGCLARPPLADAGTLLLCEASWRMPRHGMVEFAPRLAAALKLSFVFVPSFGRVGASGELRTIGNAILCSQPLRGFSRRCVGQAAISVLSASAGRRASGRPRQHQGRWPACHNRSRASGTALGPGGARASDGRFPPRDRRRSAGHYWRRLQHDHDGHGPAVVAA